MTRTEKRVWLATGLLIALYWANAGISLAIVESIQGSGAKHPDAILSLCSFLQLPSVLLVLTGVLFIRLFGPRPMNSAPKFVAKAMVVSLVIALATFGASWLPAILSMGHGRHSADWNVVWIAIFLANGAGFIAPLILSLSKLYRQIGADA
jgi:hypothetical protein